MAQNNTAKSLKDRIIDASLRLASEEDWAVISFDQIVLASQHDLSDVQEYFDDKTDILVAYGRRVDSQLFKEIPSILSDDMSEREKIFDILMERFDLISENRMAILSILDSFKGDPKQAVLTFPHLAKSMTRVLEAAGVQTGGVAGAARVTGLTGVYLYVVRTWKEDESADMAKTMATLDKALDYAESAANSLFEGNLFSGFSEVCSRFRPSGDAE